MVHDQHGRAGLLVTRFDRECQPDGSFRRLALDDAAQALDVYPAQKYAVTTEEAILALADAVGLLPRAADAAMRRALAAADRVDLSALPFDGFQRYPPRERRCSQRPCCVSENAPGAPGASAKVVEPRAQTFPLSRRRQ